MGWAGRVHFPAQHLGASVSLEVVVELHAPVYTNGGEVRKDGETLRELVLTVVRHVGEVSKCKLLEVSLVSV